MDYRQLNKRKPLGSDALERVAKEAEKGYAQFGEASPYAEREFGKHAQEVVYENEYFIMTKAGDNIVMTAGPEIEDFEGSLYDLADTGLQGNGFQWVNPEDVGALTDGEIFDLDGELYWFEAYAVQDPIEALKNGEEVVFRYGGEAPEYEEEEGMTASHRSASAQEVLMQWMESNPALKNSLVRDFSYAGSLEEAAQIMEEIIVEELGMPANADAARELGIDSVQSVDWMSLAAPLFEEEEVDFGNSPTASRKRAQEYQGWSNYSTWAVALWISNDQGLMDMVQEAAADSEDAYGLGQYIESVLDEMAPELDGVFADLMRGALSEVNWQEVAQDFLEE